jgi:hypothetical protein
MTPLSNIAVINVSEKLSASIFRTPIYHNKTISLCCLEAWIFSKMGSLTLHTAYMRFLKIYWISQNVKHIADEIHKKNKMR